ncbi:MAG TPA: hypothetical protein VMZ06_15630 [Candidatus Bathyarchaeia archaeon]|nr:hypothetical protein [Candidatus Bathyarchaeia archaeon]
MYWRLKLEETPNIDSLDHIDGRFILHKHHDHDGPHLDLRLEMDGYLMGWRIDGLSLEGRPWATEKAPHALRWLDCDTDAECVDAGVYMLQNRPGGDTRNLLLKGHGGIKQLIAERVPGLPASVARDLVTTLRENNVQPFDSPQLVRDGLAARRRAVERLCGLGRELDGNAFDASSWRALLAGLSLDEIHAQLRAYEVRFDQKYPPSPVSRPERLQEEPARTDAALSIARE